MKKILTTLAAVLLSLCLCFGFAACGGDNAGGGNNSGGTNNGGGNSNQTEDYESTGEYHTVTFDSQDGSAVESQSVLDGDYAIQPDEPQKEGKVFLYYIGRIRLRANAFFSADTGSQGILPCMLFGATITP